MASNSSKPAVSPSNECNAIKIYQPIVEDISSDEEVSTDGYLDYFDIFL